MGTLTNVPIFRLVLCDHTLAADESSNWTPPLLMVARDIPNRILDFLPSSLQGIRRS